MKKIQLAALCITPLLFIACGGETKESVSSLNSDNYLKVAKSVYAQQNGQDGGLALATPPPPGKTMDANTLYLTKSVKPRNYQISEVVVQQDGTTLSVSVDSANKYATVTLSGADTAEQTVDMKSFTVSE